KSCPGLTDLAAVTAQRTTVSPRVARTAPSAWRATRPVSSLRVFPPHSISTVFVLNIFVPSPGALLRRGHLVRAFRLARFGALMGPTAPRRIAGLQISETAHDGPLPLLAKAELRNEIGVARLVLAPEIIQQGAALVDQHQDAAARVIVLRVALEMLGEVIDALGEDRDLDLGRTGVALGLGMFLDQRFLALGCNRHRVTPVLLKVEPPDDPKAVGRCFDQRDRNFVRGRQLKPRLFRETDQPLPLTEQFGLTAVDGEGRDVVQRRGQRQYRPRQCAPLSGFLQKVQRNGGIEGEGPGAGTP